MDPEHAFDTTKDISSSPFEIGAGEKSWFDYHGSKLRVWDVGKMALGPLLVETDIQPGS